MVKMDSMSFSEALKLLKMGDKVRRIGWPQDKYISMCLPSASQRMTKPFMSQTMENSTVPYIFTFDDLLASDWWLFTDSEEDNGN